MKRLLFVDDELDVLEGLRDLFRRDRQAAWRMTFALGGEEALEQLAVVPFDVVVTDMRMPGMDGAELLRHVQHLQPEAVRIVLTGYADTDAASRAAPVAHTFLAKPCDPGVLRRALEQACGLDDLETGASPEPRAEEHG